MLVWGENSHDSAPLVSLFGRSLGSLRGVMTQRRFGGVSLKLDLKYLIKSKGNEVDSRAWGLILCGVVSRIVVVAAHQVYQATLNCTPNGGDLYGTYIVASDAIFKAITCTSLHVMSSMKTR